MNICKITQHNKLIKLIMLMLVISCIGKAQTSRNEAKLQMLLDKVSRAEAKVADAERKLAIADSLITYGEQRIEVAEEEYARIEEEQKLLEKEYMSNSKQLRKLIKSGEPEIAAQAERDLKDLDALYKADSKAYDDQIKQLTREATSGEKDIDKGTELQKSASHALKEALKALELARENYEAAVNNNQ